MSQHKGYLVPIAKMGTGSRVPVAMGACVSAGLKPAVLVRVKACKVGLKSFARFCMSRGIVIRVPVAGGEGLFYSPEHWHTVRDDVAKACGWFECAGEAEDVAALICDKSIADADWINRAANPTDCRASGSSPKK